MKKVLVIDLLLTKLLSIQLLWSQLDSVRIWQPESGRVGEDYRMLTVFAVPLLARFLHTAPLISEG